MSTHYLNPLTLPFAQKIQKDFDSANRLCDAYMVCFLLNGRVALTLSGTQHILRTNDICFLAPYEMYALTALSPDSYMLVLEISRDFVETYCGAGSRQNFKECQIRSNLDNHLYYNICREIARIIFYTINTKDCSGLYMISAITAIIGQLLDNYGCDPENDAQPGDYSRERLIGTLRYINENYQDRITLKDIAAHVGIHPQYFSTFFKKQFHQNFVDYLNQYRVQKSMALLMSDTYSITDIAQLCGFCDHKTYGAAFKKVHQMTPSAFRKAYIQDFGNRHITPAYPQALSFDPDDYFRFFQRFWNVALTQEQSDNHQQKYISLHTDLTTARPILKNRQIKINTVGRAVSCLRSNIQECIRTAKNELDFDYLRIRDIFSDDLYIYYEDGDHNVRYNWNYIDMVLDFFMSIGVKPVMEIGFMPSALASKNQTCGWQYHPNMSFPKSLGRWSNLVTEFITHCIRRYGVHQVHTWYFDFWTSPNLPLKEAYWYESQEDFFRFYKVTWQALKRVDSGIKLGSPAFSLPSGYDWYEAFFAYFRSNNMAPDYVTVHTYGCQDVPHGTSSRFPQPKSQSEAFTFSYDKDFPEKLMEEIHKLCVRMGFDSLPIFSMSWNLSFMPCDYTRDTCFMGPYIIYTFLHSLKHCAGLSYWTLCDTNDELYPDNRMFSGNPGLMDIIGLKKPAYYALALYRRLGPDIMAYDDCHVLARSAEGVQLLIYNFSFYFESYLKEAHTAPSYTERNKYFDASGEIVYHHALTLTPGMYTVRRTQLSEAFGSTYNTWLKTGSPQMIEPDLTEYIRSTSIPKLSLETVTVTGDLILDTIVPEYGIVLYEITQQIKHF